MNIPPSDHFTPLSLVDAFDARRADLPAALRTPAFLDSVHGDAQFRGIPFALGPADGANVVHLRGQPVSVDVGGVTATYFVFLHAVEDVPTVYLEGLADDQVDGNELGQSVSDYVLEYEDGERSPVPILRRFAIQQSRIQWGASAFAAVPAAGPRVFRTSSEMFELERMPGQPYGRGETRHGSGREAMAENLWLYALPNPHPQKAVRRIILEPQKEASAVYAISWTAMTEHPLRPGVRRKLRLALPDGAALNALGELDDVAIDLGNVISARAVLAYDVDAWTGDQPLVMPQRSSREVVVEYAAHPLAKLYVGAGGEGRTVYALDDLDRRSGSGIARVGSAERPVKIRIVEKETGQPAAVRLHIHGEAGEYLPPRGHHRKVNGYWFEDYYAEFVNVHNQYSYVDGECIVDLPLGTVYVEMTRGYEVAPIRTQRGGLGADGRTHIRAGPRAALATGGLGDGGYARAFPEPTDGIAGRPRRGRERSQPIGKPVGRDVLQRGRFRRAHHAGGARFRRRR